MKNSKGILIIGSDGEIGSYIFNEYKRLGIKVYGTTKRSDHSNNKKIRFNLLDKTYPFDFGDYESCLICAGINKIDFCESNPIKARNINVLSIIRLIEECKKNNIYVVYLSSVSVFDGIKPCYKIYDKPNPFSKYGRYKFEVEKFIQKNYFEMTSILRLTKVVSSNTPIIKKWFNEYAEGKTIYAYDDKFLAPIPINEVYLKINILLENKKSGIFHLSGKDDISFYDFSVNLFKKENIPDFIIKPIKFYLDENELKGKYSSLLNSFY